MHSGPRFRVWVGLLLLAGGTLVLLLPRMAVTTTGGAKLADAPASAWPVGVGAAVIGVILLLWQQRQERANR